MRVLLVQLDAASLEFGPVFDVHHREGSNMYVELGGGKDELLQEASERCCSRLLRSEMKVNEARSLRVARLRRARAGGKDVVCAFLKEGGASV